jgi:hypothetical protein
MDKGFERREKKYSAQKERRVKRGPIHGNDYEVENFTLEQIKAKTVYERSKTRNRIGLITIWAAIAAMLVAFIVGLWAGNLAYVSYVWAVVGPISAGVFGYYFRHDPKDSG